jgi:peptidyl-prolyl cis-trans isomerase D
MEGANPKQLVSIFFIVAIAVVFALNFGPGSQGCGVRPVDASATVAASVNQKDISVLEFNQRYNFQLNQFRQQGNPLPENLARQFGIPRQVLENMIDAELMGQAALEFGLNGSDEEVQDTILQSQDFQKDGAFDLAQYQLALRDYYRKTPGEFEANIRRQLAAQKLLEIVQGGANVSEEELKLRFEKDGNKAAMTFVRFLPSMFASQVALSPEETSAWAQGHAEEIKASFEKNKILYNQPEQVRARHILVKVQADASDAQKADAKARAEGLRKKIVDEKADFAELARQFSEDTGSKASGGDLGFNAAGAWVPEFSRAAFALAPGGVSEVVQSQFGFHVIKVEEKRPPQTKELKDVEQEIARTLLTKERSAALARAAAEGALAKAKGGEALSALYPAAEQAGGMPSFQVPTAPEAVESGDFTVETLSLPRLGAAPELISAALATGSPSLLDRVFPSGDGFVVAQVTSRARPTPEKFAELKDGLKSEVLRARRVELRDSYMKALRAKAKISTNDTLVGPPAAPAFGG